MPGSIALLSTDLARVQLFTPGTSTPESLPPPAEPLANARDYRRRATETAQWLATRQATRKRYAAVVLDVDESICRWVKGTSAAPPVMTAALRQQNQEWGDSGHIGLVEPITDPNAANTKPAFPFAGLINATRHANNDAESDTTNQPLERALPHEPRRGTVAIALPDALPRLVLDGLDKQGVKVNAAISLWHALAALTATSSNTDTNTHAILAIEPDRRIVWAWATQGRLLAAGTVPLEAPHSSAIDPETPETPANQTQNQRSARRLMLDWLSWSAHLGFVPDAIRILGPARHPLTTTLNDILKESDPSATVTTDHQDDGIAAALHKLAAAPRQPQPNNPRCALARLSARPNRATRQRYFTIAAALLLVATAIAGLGYRFGQQGKAWSARVSQVNAETIQTAAAMVPAARTPGAITAAGAESELNAQLAELRASTPPRSLRQPNDVAGALQRALRILSKYQDTITIEHLRFSDPSETLGPRTNSITISVPDLRTALAIFDEFQKEDPDINWERSANQRGRSENQLVLEGSWRP